MGEGPEKGRVKIGKINSFVLFVWFHCDNNFYGQIYLLNNIQSSTTFAYNKIMVKYMNFMN